jgi:hypothetical protein
LCPLEEFVSPEFAEQQRSAKPKECREVQRLAHQAQKEAE